MPPPAAPVALALAVLVLLLLLLPLLLLLHAAMASAEETAMTAATVFLIRASFLAAPGMPSS